MPGSFQRTQSPGPTVAFPEAAPSLAHVAASLPQRHPPRAGEKLLRGSTGREAAAAGWVSMPAACLQHACSMPVECGFLRERPQLTRDPREDQRM